MPINTFESSGYCYPKSGLLGGFFQVEFASDADVSFLEKMVMIERGERNFETLSDDDYVRMNCFSGKLSCHFNEAESGKVYEWKHAIVTYYEEIAHSLTGEPMKTLVVFSPFDLRVNNLLISRYSGKAEKGTWYFYESEEEQQPKPASKPTVLVTKVDGKEEAQPNEKVTYKVVEFNQKDVTENDKKGIQWAIKIDDKQEVLKEKGEKLELTIKEEWAGKEIIVMPYLVKPNEKEVSKKTKISDTMNYIVIPEKGTIKKDFSKKSQMKKYKINGRNASELTIKSLLREKKMGNISISESIKYITSDYNGKYNYNFPNDYYAIIGELLFVMNYSKYMNMSKIPKLIRIWYALEESCQLVDGDKGFKGGEGAPLFHIYENVVRRNDDTGIDKLLHFLYSAKYAFLTGAKISGFLGKAKEFVNDEVHSWFNPNDIGWDNKDIEANNLGIKFGKKLQNRI